MPKCMHNKLFKPLRCRNAFSTREKVKINIKRSKIVGKKHIESILIQIEN